MDVEEVISRHPIGRTSTGCAASTQARIGNGGLPYCPYMEHAQRYKRLASELVKHGFVVYVNDHRGHGKTATEFQNNPLGVALNERQRRLNSLTSCRPSFYKVFK